MNTYRFLQALLLVGVVAGNGCWQNPPVQDTGDAPADAAAPAGNLLDLSAKAQKTIGLKVGPVKRTRYIDTVVVPGALVEVPGRTMQHVPAPLDGIVKRIMRTEGEMVRPGEPLFVLQLMHEELARDQGVLIKLTKDLHVVDSEIARLERLVKDGIAERRQLIDKNNEKQKINSQLVALRQQLLLHGLSEEHIKQIAEQEELVRNVVASAAQSVEAEDDSVRLLIQRLEVSVGEHVEHGTSLCTLVDFSKLYIKGQAFGADMPYLRDIIGTRRLVRAVIGSGLTQQESVEELFVERLDNRVDPQTRLHSFFVRLPNALVSTGDDNGRYAQWKFTPGQRAKIHLPVMTMEDRVVLPVEAVAQDGLESYVFRQNGDMFVREAVEVERRDTRQQIVVLAPGQLYDGTVIAMNCADLMNLEFKNRGAEPLDAHAGHSH